MQTRCKDVGQATLSYLQQFEKHSGTFTHTYLNENKFHGFRGFLPIPQKYDCLTHKIRNHYPRKSISPQSFFENFFIKHKID